MMACRRTDGGSIYDSAEVDAEMEKAALVARAQGVAEAEMGVATATLVKVSPDQKLGIVLTCGGDVKAPLHISKLRPGGLAALCGKLQLGDRVVEINGCEVAHPIQATDIFRAAHHKVELRVQRPPEMPASLPATPLGTRRTGTNRSSGGRSDTSLGRNTTGESLLLDPVPRMRKALLELATEAARSVESDYFRFLESKHGDAYISRLLIKRVLIGTKSDTHEIDRPLSELSDVPMSVLSVLNEDVATDPTDYASGW